MGFFMAGINLDLRKTWLTRQHRDIIAVYAWVNDERALILIPAYRKGAPWYIVLESAAYKYDDPAYLAKQCVKACEVLGIEGSKPNWVRVATIINEGLPDLVRMPSAPPVEKSEQSFGELKVMEDGKQVGSEEIKVEKTGVNYG